MQLPCKIFKASAHSDPRPRRVHDALLVGCTRIAPRPPEPANGDQSFGKTPTKLSCLMLPFHTMCNMNYIAVRDAEEGTLTQTLINVFFLNDPNPKLRQIGKRFNGSALYSHQESLHDLPPRWQRSPSRLFCIHPLWLNGESPFWTSNGLMSMRHGTPTQSPQINRNEVEVESPSFTDRTSWIQFQGTKK